jgi:hypothetical protein
MQPAALHSGLSPVPPPDFSTDPRVVRAGVDGSGASGTAGGGGLEEDGAGAAVDALSAIGEADGGMSETAMVRAAEAEEEDMAQGKGQRTMMRERALAAVEARIAGSESPSPPDDDDNDDDNGGGSGGDGGDGGDGAELDGRVAESNAAVAESNAAAEGAASAAELAAAAVGGGGGGLEFEAGAENAGEDAEDADAA